MYTATRVTKAGPSTTAATSGCPKCGTIRTGESSCCGRGGTWAGKCGNEVNAKFEHTWVEGVQVCSSASALNAGHSEPDGSQETQAQETSTQGTVYGEDSVYDAGNERHVSSQVYAKLTRAIGYVAAAIVASCV